MEIKCNSCGHVWSYTGMFLKYKKFYVNCPVCRYGNKIIEGKQIKKK